MDLGFAADKPRQHVASFHFDIKYREDVDPKKSLAIDAHGQLGEVAADGHRLQQRAGGGVEDAQLLVAFDLCGGFLVLAKKAQHLRSAAKIGHFLYLAILLDAANDFAGVGVAHFHGAGDILYACAQQNLFAVGRQGHAPGIVGHVYLANLFFLVDVPDVGHSGVMATGHARAVLGNCHGSDGVFHDHFGQEVSGGRIPDAHRAVDAASDQAFAVAGKCDADDAVEVALEFVEEFAGGGVEDISAAVGRRGGQPFAVGGEGDAYHSLGRGGILPDQGLLEGLRQRGRRAGCRSHRRACRRGVGLGAADLGDRENQ